MPSLVSGPIVRARGRVTRNPHEERMGNMTPNEMVQVIQGAGIVCAIGNTGGNCGAIIVPLASSAIMITTESGPWATPADDNVSRGERWFVAWDDSTDGGTWVDGDLVRDGDATFTDSQVPYAVARLIGYASR